MVTTKTTAMLTRTTVTAVPKRPQPNSAATADAARMQVWPRTEETPFHGDHPVRH